MPKKRTDSSREQALPLKDPPLDGKPDDAEAIDGQVIPDGGWGWVVCLASFWTNGTVFGIINSFGVMYVKFLEHFAGTGEEVAFKTSWVGSVNVGLTFITSPIASILVDRIGIRPTALIGGVLATSGMLISSFMVQLEVLYLTYGVLLGVGSSLVYTPSLVILGHYFHKRLGLVNGLVTFGSGVFTITLPFLLNFLLREIDLRNTMRVLTGFYAVLILCALTWKPLLSTREDNETHTIKEYLSTESLHRAAKGCKAACGKVLNLDVWKNKGYTVWVLSVPVCLLGYFIPFVHIVKHTKDILPDASGEALVMCIGVTSAVGRLIVGKLADMPNVNRIAMQQTSFVIFGIVCSCIPFAKTFIALVIITLVMGLCDGCFICLLGAIAIDLLGPKNGSQGIGFMLGLIAIPLTIGPPVAGLVYDLMGSYEIAFYAAGTPPLIGALLMFLVPKPKVSKDVLDQDYVVDKNSHEDDDEINTGNIKIIDHSQNTNRDSSRKLLPKDVKNGQNIVTDSEYVA